MERLEYMHYCTANNDEETVLCPTCGIDAIIGDKTVTWTRADVERWHKMVTLEPRSWIHSSNKVSPIIFRSTLTHFLGSLNKAHCY